ncbi:uncharacterized protein LOC115077168 [Rhinatrema bivittatum]|uniref:uncharacterized protein LOC115077168 n=1 Tax=Rhinatrema bivittatum TaxID=194408 RepID=UPI001127CB26|nr:uncharacterized protein LOC115077168 [Rhinatrema bivittatum]
MSLSGEERVQLCLPVNDRCQTLADTVALLLALMIALTIAVNLITLLLHRIHFYLKKYLWIFSSPDNVGEKKPDPRFKARMQPVKPMADGCRGTRHREQEDRSCWVRPRYPDHHMEEHALNLRDTDEEKACRYRYHRIQEDHHCRERERPGGTCSHRSNYDGSLSPGYHRGSMAVQGPEQCRLQGADVRVRPDVIYREVLPHSRPRVIRLDSTPPVEQPCSRPGTPGSQSPNVTDLDPNATNSKPHTRSKPIAVSYESAHSVNQFQCPDSPEMAYTTTPVFRPQTPGPIDPGPQPQARSNYRELDDPAQCDLYQSPTSAPPMIPDTQEEEMCPNPLLYTSPTCRPYHTSYHNDQSWEKPPNFIPEYLSPPSPVESHQDSRGQCRPGFQAKDSQYSSPKHGCSSNPWAETSSKQDSMHHPLSPLAASHDPLSGRVVYDARALHGQARGPVEVKEEVEEKEDWGQSDNLRSVLAKEIASGWEGNCGRRNTFPYGSAKLTFNLPPPINSNRYHMQMPRAKISKNPRVQAQTTDYPQVQSSKFNRSIQ